MPKGKDIFWDYAILNEERKIVCKFCNGIYAGGITRFNYHLACMECHDVAICNQVPENVMKLAQKACKTLGSKMQSKKGGPCSSGSVGIGFGASSSCIGSSSAPGGQQQTTIAHMFKSKEKDQIDDLLFRSMAMNNLPFNLLRSNDFRNFVVAVSNHGPGYFPPSSEIARTKLLDNARKEVQAYVEEMKASWSDYGCTIMSDIWKDTIRSRS